MTDKKQIIIDGVDVSKCSEQGLTQAGITCGTAERIRFGNEYIYKHTLCKDSPNCLYKQLKLKEQECEGIKLQLKQVKYLYEVQDEQLIDELSTENKKLKAENETYKKMLDNSEFRVALIDVKTGEREVWRKLGSKAQKYKQALDEIEEYLKTQLDGFGNAVYSVEKLAITKISDIINKAKEGE